MKKTVKIKFQVAIQVYQVENDLVAVAKMISLGLNCSMDYCFFLFLLLPVIVLLKKRKKE
jgi:hypothetical protein